METIQKFIQEHYELFGAGFLSLWIYKENIKDLRTWEIFAYWALSVFVGNVGGVALSEYWNIDIASGKHIALTVLITVFALPLLALARDNLSDIFNKWRAK